MADTGVTSAGFVIKTLETIKEELESDFIAINSTLEVTNPNTSVGQLIGNQSAKFATLWEAFQFSYNSLDPDNATGQALDRVSNMVGVRRLTAVSTIVNELCIANEGTIILANSRVSKADTSIEFANAVQTTVTATAATRVIISITVQDTTLYRVTLGGVNFDYTSDASATATEIIVGLKAVIDAAIPAQPVIVTDNGDDTFTILEETSISTFSIVLSANLAISELGTNVVFTALIADSTTAPINTVTVIETPISGWSSVTNLVSGTVGRGVETDAALRIRRAASVGALGKATEIAIQNSLLQDVLNVSSAIVFSNRTDVTDAESRPPHSFEAIVAGGTDSDVANNIWENMPAGIQPYGNTTVNITDSTGRTQEIKFSRPVNVYIWLEIDIGLYSEEDFPTNGLALIKEDIVTWSLTEYVAGKDVIRQRINTPIYQTPGIGDVTIRTGQSANPAVPPGAYAEADITITASQIAVFDVSRMEVNIIP